MKDRIRRVRKDLNMNQTEFGQELGCTQAAITSYETGRVVPDKSTRLLLCSKFNVNESWLETGEGVPYKEGLLPALADALRQMPAVSATLERLLPRLTHEDLEHLNDLVQRIISEK